MMQKRPIRTILLAAVTLVAMLASSNYSYLKAAAFTVPTRTPTPSAEEPSATPDEGNGPGPLPTSTSPPPTATATNTPVVIPATPEGGILPTANPCDPNPTVQSLGGGTNVRRGPGLDYEPITQLRYLEVRPISGRAQYAEWWQIVLSDGTLGWVTDEVVAVSGYIGAVPVVEAPALADGTTPTPGTPWAPTPQPNCTPPPSPTSTPSATPSSTSTPTATLTPEPTEEKIESAAASEGNEEEAPTATSVIPTPEPTATGEGDENTAAGGRATVTPAPLEADAGGEGSIPWMPVAGISLLFAAAVLYVLRRVGS